jgi:hypothetical protein
MRTDIPAFYAKWLLNRIREGYVLVRNPYHPQSVTRYSLSPDVVDLMAFCTKNPAPLLSSMDILKPYGQYWFVTITPYGTDVEPNVPPKESVMKDFRRLSDMVGVDSVGWRYDPVFINETYTLERHISDFAAMAETLAGYTRTCVISFIDLYEKVKRNFSMVREVSPYERITIGREFVRIGKKYGMTIKSCAEGTDLQPYGVDCGGCMTAQTYETALHTNLKLPKMKTARKECACFLTNDIGAYNTCGHLCRYCYANANADIVRRNLKSHNPASPLLLGELHADDVIRNAKQESWIDYQLHF